MPTNGAPERQIGNRRELRTTDSRTTILTNRLSNRYFVQIGRLIFAPKGVEKRSLRIVKVELGEGEDA
jgi:hypothetical protein